MAILVAHQRLRVNTPNESIRKTANIEIELAKTKTINFEEAVAILRSADN